MLFEEIVIYFAFLERENHHEKTVPFEIALGRPPTGFIDLLWGPLSADQGFCDERPIKDNTFSHAIMA